MNHWTRYQKHLVRYADLGVSLDISRMDFADDFFAKMEPLVQRAMADMKDLEAGALANPDEQRMVGHYWLRNADLAPTKEIREAIKQDFTDARAFASEVHNGNVVAANGEKFTRLLVIGIGGSALGPQFMTDALVDSWKAPLKTHFFDNTDPDGMQRVLETIGPDLAQTLTVVISKSGGTAESNNLVGRRRGHQRIRTGRSPSGLPTIRWRPPARAAIRVLARSHRVFLPRLAGRSYGRSVACFLRLQSFRRRPQVAAPR